MATMNDASPCAGLSLHERVHIALELAENISMEHDGFHHLVSDLVGQLPPWDWRKAARKNTEDWPRPQPRIIEMPQA